MSKAFTRESDDGAEPAPLPRTSSLPPGAKNYMTPGGADHLRQELESLIQTDRPAVAAAGDDPEARRRLHILDRRIHQLQRSLESAVIVPIPPNTEPVVRFGATVTVRRTAGTIDVYRIVGADETDVERGWVSWVSPIARALLNKTVQDRVRFRFPSGEEELAIEAVTYD